MSYDGHPLHNTDQFVFAMDKAGPGMKVLSYRRGETIFSLEIPAGVLGVFTVNVRAAAP